MARGKRINGETEERINIEIGERITKLREKRGFSQVDFARAVQISPSRLY